MAAVPEGAAAISISYSGKLFRARVVLLACERNEIAELPDVPRSRYPRYSAASLTGSTRSTLAAQNLNSGIFPNGSSFGLVSRFAAAST